MVPSAEALETVSISTSNYDAEFGRAGGAVTSVTLKSGTNQFKGSALLLRQHRRDAGEEPVHRSHAARRNGRRPKAAYHQGGFTLGGPIMRNKLFFFGDYIRTNDDLGRVNRYVVPTAAMRNGDFSASSVPIFDPLTGDQATGAEPHAVPEQPDSGQPHQPDRAAHPREHSAAEHRRRALGQVNYQDTTTRERRTDGFDVKINYQVSSKDQRLGPLQLPASDGVRAFATSAAISAGPYQDGFIGTGVNTTYSVAGNWTRTWSNTLVMDARVGVSTYHNVATQRGQRPATRRPISASPARTSTSTRAA